MSNTSSHPALSQAQTKKPRTRLSRDAKLAVLLFFLGWVMSYADRQLITLALPYIGEDLSLSPTQQGMLISAFFVTYAIVQIPGGMLVDRLGAKRTAVAGVLAWSVFTVATGTAGSFAVMLAVRALFGIGEGVYPAASVKAVAERTTSEQRMTATGWMYSSNAVGTIVAAVAGAALIGFIGWQGAFFVLGAVGVLVAVAIGVFLPKVRADSAAAIAVEEEAASTIATKDLFRSAALWGHVAMFFGYGVVAWGMSAWVPSYLVSARGIPLGVVAAAAVIPVLAGGVASILGGRLVDRLGGRHRLIVVPGMLACILVLAMMTQELPVPVFITLIGLLSFFSGMCYMPVFSSPVRGLPTGVVGTAYATISTGSQVAGILTPTIMGVVVENVSWEAAFGVLIAGCVICLVAALLVPRGPEEFLATFTRREKATADAI
ncbi:MFS transporter [Microbacterium sp. LWO13-1.2]|uniref:MFS transporter n=1 Tax=Microbacterium sp. LWO13-1.2 TaxID=3135262 RepID=UPI003139006B